MHSCPDFLFAGSGKDREKVLAHLTQDQEQKHPVFRDYFSYKGDRR